jgi:hypothetical protein
MESKSIIVKNGKSNVERIQRHMRIQKRDEKKYWDRMKSEVA